MPEHIHASPDESGDELASFPDADDIAVLTKWAKSLARGVCQDFYFRKGSQEEADLESQAYVALFSRLARFDRTRARSQDRENLRGAFRGYAADYVRGEIRREATRIRNGGMFHTRRDHSPFTVRELSSYPRNDDGTLPYDQLDPQALDPNAYRESEIDSRNSWQFDDS